MNESKSIVTCI